jgi:hypothetical protein
VTYRSRVLRRGGRKPNSHLSSLMAYLGCISSERSGTGRLIQGTERRSPKCDSQLPAAVHRVPKSSLALVVS